jgi:hypothetical protein
MQVRLALPSFADPKQRTLAQARGGEEAVPTGLRVSRQRVRYGPHPQHQRASRVHHRHCILVDRHDDIS